MVIEKKKPSQEEIEKITKMKVKDEDWDTSQFPYMTNEQIIEVHRCVYDTLIKQVKQLRGGVSIGDFGVPMIVSNLLEETKKRFGCEK